MIRVGIGAEGRLIPNVLVSAALPLATPGVIVGIWDLAMVDWFSLQLISRSRVGAFTGTWLVEASNNYAPAAGATNFGQAAYAGDWNDVTTLFTPAITTAIGADASQITEPTLRPNGWRALRVTATRTGGTSAVIDAWLCGKGA